MSDRSSSGGALTGAIFLGLFGLFFAAMGAFAVIATVNGDTSGDDPAWVGVAVGSLFIVVGCGIIYAGVATYRKSNENAKLAAQYPDSPWLLNKEWAEGRIRDGGKARFMALAGIAIFWNAIAWPAAIGVYQEGSGADQAARWLVLLFPLVGVFLIAAAIYQFLRWRKYGESVFEMAEVPGVLGGSLGGIVLTSVNIKPGKGFQVTLRNQKKVTTGSGKNRRTTTTTLWESEQWIHEDAMADDPARSALPIYFGIPYECAPTGNEGKAEFLWELRVRAETPGVDYDARFHVPVYQTALSVPSFDEDAARSAVDSHPPPEMVDWSKGGLTVRDDPGGATVIETTAGRHLMFLLPPALVGAGMLAGAGIAWNSDVPRLFSVVFGAFGLLITFGLAGTLFSSLRLSVDRHAIESESRYFFIRKRRRTPREAIVRLECESTLSSGETHFYDLVAHTQGGEKVKLPLKAKGKTRAEALRRIVENKLALREE